MSDLNFSLTEQEANLVLQALARAPYEQVFQLIAKLQGQALSQIHTSPLAGEVERNEGEGL